MGAGALKNFRHAATRMQIAKNFHMVWMHAIEDRPGAYQSAANALSDFCTQTPDRRAPGNAFRLRHEQIEDPICGHLVVPYDEVPYLDQVLLGSRGTAKLHHRLRAMKTTTRLRANILETLKTAGATFDSFLDEAAQLLDADRIDPSLSPPFLNRLEKGVALTCIFAPFDGGGNLGRKIVWKRELNEMPAHYALRIVTVLSNQ